MIAVRRKETYVHSTQSIGREIVRHEGQEIIVIYNDVITVSDYSPMQQKELSILEHDATKKQ